MEHKRNDQGITSPIECTSKMPQGPEEQEMTGK